MHNNESNSVGVCMPKKKRKQDPLKAKRNATVYFSSMRKKHDDEYKRNNNNGKNLKTAKSQSIEPPRRVKLLPKTISRPRAGRLRLVRRHKATAAAAHLNISNSAEEGKFIATEEEEEDPNKTTGGDEPIVKKQYGHGGRCRQVKDDDDDDDDELNTDDIIPTKGDEDIMDTAELELLKRGIKPTKASIINTKSIGSNEGNGESSSSSVASKSTLMDNNDRPQMDDDDDKSSRKLLCGGRKKTSNLKKDDDNSKSTSREKETAEKTESKYPCSDGKAAAAKKEKAAAKEEKHASSSDIVVKTASWNYLLTVPFIPPVVTTSESILENDGEKELQKPLLRCNNFHNYRHHGGIRISKKYRSQSIVSSDKEYFEFDSIGHDY